MEQSVPAHPSLSCSFNRAILKGISPQKIVYVCFLFGCGLTWGRKRMYLWWSLCTLCWHTCQGESYRRWLRSLLLCHDIFWVLINSLVCWFWLRKGTPLCVDSDFGKGFKDTYNYTRGLEVCVCFFFLLPSSSSWNI